jgi:hypothetical protein
MSTTKTLHKINTQCESLQKKKSMATDDTIPIPIELEQNTMKMLNNSASGFKIKRIINGRPLNIELSCQELNNAFYYQEHKFYVLDIEGVLQEMENEDSLSGKTAEEIRSNADLMTVIVSKYKKNRDDYNMEWYDAAQKAIEDNLLEKGENSHDKM